MTKEQQLQLEAEKLKSTVYNAVNAWNKELKKTGNFLRFEFSLDFEEAASSKSDSPIHFEKLKVIGSVASEKAVLRIYSFKVTTPSDKTKLIEYTHTFAPHDFGQQMTEASYNDATIIILQKLLVEAFGTYLITLDKHVNG